jgi:tRNA pseudouridine32 synthase / 23S rRNA pseudouridine746 synthase
MPTQLYKLQITDPDELALSALARISQLPKGRLKDAMAKGAVWLKRGNKTKRLRRATFKPLPGDELSLYYNPEVLALKPPQAQLLSDEKHYSVWIKPAGLLAQGSQEGDHCSLLRQVELVLKRDVFLIHRLDREAAGLMLIAHTGKAAAALSALFAATDGQERINKFYQVEVAGQLPAQGEINIPLDNKAALTRYTRLQHDPSRNRSVAKVQLISGRKHQIRRHFAESGFPVIGDPVYGTNNKDERGLQLFAVELAFVCPLTKVARHYQWAVGSI